MFLLLKLHNWYFSYKAEKDRILWEHREEKKRVFGIHRNTNDLIIEQGTVLIRILWKLELVYDYLFQKEPI